MPSDNNQEMFPVVDEQGNITGAATRGECHSGSRLLHPVVHLHIFNISAQPNVAQARSSPWRVAGSSSSRVRWCQPYCTASASIATAQPSPQAALRARRGAGVWSISIGGGVNGGTGAGSAAAAGSSVASTVSAPIGVSDPVAGSGTAAAAGSGVASRRHTPSDAGASPHVS